MIRWIRRAIAHAAIAVVALAGAQSAAIAQPVFNSKTVSVYELSKAAATQRPTAPVAAQIAELSDAASTRRDAAEQSLVAMGPAIEPQLRWALVREDSAVPADQLTMRGSTRVTKELWGPGYLLPQYAYHSLSGLIDDLEDHQRATPSSVTLHYASAPLTDVLRAFGEQIHANVSIVATNDGYAAIPSVEWVTAARTTINLDAANYWDALRVILDGLPLRPSRSAAGLSLVEHPGFSAFFADSIDGPGAPLQVHAPGVVVAGPLLLAASVAASRGTILTLRVVAEPRVAGVTHLARVQIDACTDDRGRSLLIGEQRLFFSAAGKYGYGWSDEPWIVSIPLAALAPGRHVGTIRGHVDVGIAPPSQNIPLSGLTHPNEQSVSFDGVVVTARSVAPTDSGYLVSGQLSTSIDILSTRETYEYLRVRPLDEMRQLILRGQTTFGAVRHEPGRNVVDWKFTTFGTEQVPATLMWATPEETRWLTVPFELRTTDTAKVRTP